MIFKRLAFLLLVCVLASSCSEFDFSSEESSSEETSVVVEEQVVDEEADEAEEDQEEDTTYKHPANSLTRFLI